MEEIKRYLQLCRPNQWIKNLLIVPGFLFAYFLAASHHSHLIGNLVLAYVSACFLSSANYIINDWVDRNNDQYHPHKRVRVTVQHRLQFKYIILEYIILFAFGLMLACLISKAYLMTSVVFLLLGVIYNLPPIRAKDIVFVDVLTEALNNPIRLLLGWFTIVNVSFPSITLLLTFWLAGGFVMAVKRYAELQVFPNTTVAAFYRQSFQFYTSHTLILTALIYGITAIIFWFSFILSHEIFLVILSPLYLILFYWYLLIGLKPASLAQSPEYLYKEKKFMLFAILVACLTFIIFFVTPQTIAHKKITHQPATYLA